MFSPHHVPLWKTDLIGISIFEINFKPVPGSDRKLVFGAHPGIREYSKSHPQRYASDYFFAIRGIGRSNSIDIPRILQIFKKKKNL